MTWKTSEGERVLSGPEAKLFASAIATMIDLANDSGDGLNYGIPLVEGAFQRLSDAKKFSALEEVARALLHPTPTCPELTATNESAICYVFNWLKDQFDDVEAGEDVWGQLVLDALAEEEEEEEEEGEGFRPRIGWRPCCPNTDSGKWEDALDGLADRILWDRDFEMEAQFVGAANPEAAAQTMAMMNIDPAYFQPFTGAASRGAKERLYDMVRAVSD